MPDFPLLDLESAFKDAHALLQEVVDRAQALWTDSDCTDLDMLIIATHAMQAQGKLGTLPAGVCKGITQDRADLDAMEANAPGNVNGY